MTTAQWLFEYHALKEKENAATEKQIEIMKASATILQQTLVGVFGLNLFAEDKKDPKAFMPGAFVFGNHHLLAPLLEREKQQVDTEKALTDDAFEEFSKKLARGEVGDMDPILVGGVPLKNSFWNSIDAQQTLASLGVKPRPETAPLVPHFGKKVAAPPPVPEAGKIQFDDSEEDEPRYRPGLELEPGLVGGED